MSAVRQVWCGALRMWGFAVEEATNGLEAVERAQAHPPDLVLMDIAMPVMDGIRATAALRKDPRTAATPVVAVSGAVSEEVTNEAIAAGADIVLAKPLSLRDLIRNIRLILGRPEMGGPPPTPGGVS